MKKVLVLIVILLSILLLCFYKFKVSKAVIENSLPENLIVGINNDFITTSKLQDKTMATDKPEDFVDKKLDGIEEKYDKSLEEFDSLVLNLFLGELALSKDVFEDYLQMRKGLANDKLAVFESFHKKMEEKYGENYSYNPSDDEIQFEKDIQMKYDNLLIKKIGKEKFIKYLELRDGFNNTLIENQDPEAGVILMEF